MVWVTCDFKKNAGSKVNSVICHFCTEKKCPVGKSLPLERVAKHDKSLVKKDQSKTDGGLTDD